MEDLVTGIESEYRSIHPDEKLLHTVYPPQNLKFWKFNHSKKTLKALRKCQ